MKKMLVLAVLLTACCPSRRYPDDVRNEFLVECAQDDIPVRPCICVLEGFEKRYTLEEFRTISVGMKKGAPMPKEMGAIVDRCALEEREHDKEKKR